MADTASTINEGGPGASSTAFALDSSAELRDLLGALQAMKIGDFAVRMRGDHTGLIGKIADTFNDIVSANERMATELERVGETVGREGKTNQRVRFGLSAGAWGEMEHSVNTLIDDLVWPTHEIRRGGRAWPGWWRRNCRPISPARGSRRRGRG